VWLPRRAPHRATRWDILRPATATLALGQFGGQELHGAKLVGAREFVESGKQVSELHGGKIRNQRWFANHVFASSFPMFPMISAMRALSSECWRRVAQAAGA
jgi:hypothetical protein